MGFRERSRIHTKSRGQDGEESDPDKRRKRERVMDIFRRHKPPEDVAECSRDLEGDNPRKSRWKRLKWTKRAPKTSCFEQRTLTEITSESEASDGSSSIEAPRIAVRNRRNPRFGLDFSSKALSAALPSWLTTASQGHQPSVAVEIATNHDEDDIRTLQHEQPAYPDREMSMIYGSRISPFQPSTESPSLQKLGAFDLDRNVSTVDFDLHTNQEHLERSIFGERTLESDVMTGIDMMVFGARHLPTPHKDESHFWLAETMSPDLETALAPIEPVPVAASTSVAQGENSFHSNAGSSSPASVATMGSLAIEEHFKELLHEYGVESTCSARTSLGDSVCDDARAQEKPQQSATACATHAASNSQGYLEAKANVDMRLPAERLEPTSGELVLTSLFSTQILDFDEGIQAPSTRGSSPSSSSPWDYQSAHTSATSLSLHDNGHALSSIEEGEDIVEVKQRQPPATLLTNGSILSLSDPMNFHGYIFPDPPADVADPELIPFIASLSEDSLFRRITSADLVE